MVSISNLWEIKRADQAWDPLKVCHHQCEFQAPRLHWTLKNHHQTGRASSRVCRCLYLSEMIAIGGKYIYIMGAQLKVKVRGKTEGCTSYACIMIGLANGFFTMLLWSILLFTFKRSKTKDNKLLNAFMAISSWAAFNFCIRFRWERLYSNSWRRWICWSFRNLSPSVMASLSSIFSSSPMSRKM